MLVCLFVCLMGIRNDNKDMIFAHNIRSAPKHLFYDSMYNSMSVICLTETWNNETFNEDTVEIYNLRQFNGAHL